ncbi:MAG TPA: hypothetical protein VGE37_05130 [Archangium sp.]
MSWKKLRAARASRGRSALHALPAGSLPKNDAARRFWSERTWSEFAAVPAVSQVVLALVREGAPLETLGAYTAIADDEVRHALLSKALADAFGGYVDEVPEGLGYAPRGLAAPSDVPVHVWALANGCFSETVSLALIRGRHAVTEQPVVRAVLSETRKDEAVHVRVAWALADELLPALPRAEKKELRAYAQELGEMLRRTFGTKGLPPTLRRRERKLRDGTAEAGLGALGADAEDAIVERALGEIEARLGRLMR